MSGRYAEGTSVSVERTRAEIESVLSKYGAKSFAYMTDERGAKIGFKIENRSVRFDLPLPNPQAPAFTEFYRGSQRHRRTPDSAREMWEQACRSRWRALLLCIKAKLEACAVGITTFDSEFLAHIVTEDGRTVAERIIPQLTDGGGPLLLS